MRKFKLKKLYPGVYIDVGTVVTLHAGLCYFPENGGNGINPQYVENQPEFWKEIKDEYPKIISFINDRKKVAILQEDNEYHYSVGSCCVAPLDEMFESVSIYQVAKNKDEVFTVGDRVREGIITGFRFTSDGLYQYSCNNKDNCINILCAVKQLAPLFTTYDGIELFSKDDLIYGVLPKANWQINFGQHLGGFQDLTRKTEWLYFSSKEKVDAYVDENRPRFSKKNIRDIIDLHRSHNAWDVLQEFKRKLTL